ncbi:MAG: hypothetical protein J7605_16235 [Variovorax sp.]|nr:hypothetical protein [Variovorax sp.]
MNAVTSRLEQVIREIGDPTSPAYRNLRAVLEQSPALMQQMNDALEHGHLRHFALMPEAENAGASYDPETRTINLKRSDLLDAKQRDALTFLIGHEIQHGINRGRTRQGLEQFDKSVRGVLESGQPVHDYTSALDQMLAINRSDEANAHISGWNALASRVKQGNPEADLSDLGKLAKDVGYVFDFIEVKEVGGSPQFTAKEGFTFNTDLSLTPHPRNIEAAGKHYFDKRPDDAQLGHHGNSDYTNYYAAGLVGSVCQYELLNPSVAGEVHLDMRGLRLQEALLEQNGISLGNAAARCLYRDLHAPEIARHFDHTADSHRHMPINALPTPTELSADLNRSPPVVQLDDPSHPDHRLFRQA